MNTELIEYNGYKIKVWEDEDGWHSYSKVSSPIVKQTRSASIEATKQEIDSSNVLTPQSGIREIFVEANETLGGDDVSLDSALKASARKPHEDNQQYETVVIDGDEYEFEVKKETEPKFVAVTTIGQGTGMIFLAEGNTEDEVRDKGLDAILPEDMWKHANIYDVTKRQNIRIIKIGKARQLGYRGKQTNYSGMVDDEDFGAY